MFFKKAFYIICGISLANTALASGYQISEYSAVGLGRSFAGAGVNGDDFSAIGYNPAGMQYNQTNGVQAGTAAIVLHADYNDRTTNTKDESTMARVLPHFFTQYKLSDKLTLGAGIYTPYGLITDYNNNWSQSSHGIFSGLKAVDLSTAVSYQIHPMIALGVALNGQYAHARLTSGDTSSAKDLQGDNINAGYSLGLTFTPRKDIRLGLSYRSKITHDLEGDIKISNAPIASLNGKTDVKAKITTPELFLLSGAYDVNQNLTLSGSARWTKWSRFNQLDIVTTQQMNSYVPGHGVVQLPSGTTISSTHENWKNTWFFSLGADYKINQNWTVRFGGAYDETVIKSPAYRTVRIPDGRRLFASLGLSYMTGNWQYDVGYTHVWMRAGNATGKDNLSSTTPDVRYNNAGAYMAGASIQYKF